MPPRHKRPNPYRPLPAISRDQSGHNGIYEQYGRKNSKPRNGNPLFHPTKQNPHSSAYQPHPAIPLPPRSCQRHRLLPGSASPYYRGNSIGAPLRDISNPKHHACIQKIVSDASLLSTQLQDFLKGLADFLKPDREEMDWETTNAKEIVTVASEEVMKPSIKPVVWQDFANCCAMAVPVAPAAPRGLHRREGDRGNGCCTEGGEEREMVDAYCSNGPSFIGSLGGEIWRVAS